jgi:hypothetical protein
MLVKICLVNKLLEERFKTGEGDEEDISRYCMILRKLESTGS